MWQRLSAVRMFIEHVYPSADESHPEDVQQMLRLWKVMPGYTRSSHVPLVSVVTKFNIALRRYMRDVLFWWQGSEKIWQRMSHWVQILSHGSLFRDLWWRCRWFLWNYFRHGKGCVCSHFCIKSSFSLKHCPMFRPWVTGQTFQRRIL